MSRSKIFIARSVLLLASIACNFTAPAESTPPPLTVIVEPTLPPQDNVLQSEDQVPRIPIEQALAAVQSGAAVIVDVRSVQAYEDSHVPGALSIPLAEIEADPNGLPLDKDQWIITYCT
jgi:hypothetical protein